MSKVLTKVGLAAAVSRRVGIRIDEADRAIDACLDVIQESLQAGHRVTLLRFGSFVVAERPARPGVHPRTLQPMVVPPIRQIRFRPGKDLRMAVQIAESGEGSD